MLLGLRIGTRMPVFGAGRDRCGSPPRVAILSFALLLAALPAIAQTTPPLAQPTFGFQREVTVQTFAAQGAATVNSADQRAAGSRGLYCTLNASAAGGSPSTTFAIQAKDAASGTYRTLLTSAAITATATPESIEIYPGIQTTSLPTHLTTISLAIPLVYRIQTIVGGTSTPTITGTVGCAGIP